MRLGEVVPASPPRVSSPSLGAAGAGFAFVRTSAIGQKRKFDDPGKAVNRRRHQSDQVPQNVR